MEKIHEFSIYKKHFSQLQTGKVYAIK